MNNQQLTKSEKKHIHRALHYYLNEATHEQRNGSAAPGLPEGRERAKILSGMEKLGIK